MGNDLRSRLHRPGLIPGAIRELEPAVERARVPAPKQALVTVPIPVLVPMLVLALVPALLWGCRTPKPARPKGGNLVGTGGGKKLEDKKKRGLDMLSRQVSLRFDEKGRLTKDVRLQYRFKTRNAVKRYDGVGAEWAPWFERRPRLRATVRTPDGGEHRLDPSTIAVQPVPSGRSRILTDRRRLHAKLPALTRGAVVTLEIRHREKRPLVSAGGVHFVPVAPWLPTRAVRLEVEAPADRPLHVGLRGLDLKPKKDETSGGRRRIVYEAGPFTKNELYEPLLPYEAPRQPYLVVSSAASWAAVADAYRRRIRRQLRHGRAKAVVAEVKRTLGGPNQGRLALLRALLSRLRKRLRYTSLAFGEKAIVPVRPAVALERGYGDCKDMSTTLVTWLRAAGIEAHLALLRAGKGDDVSPAHPGLDGFNHAIVYVPAAGDAPARWLDPTATFTRPAVPPWSIQDRWALVIRPGTRRLTRIPALPPAKNRYREERTVRFQPEGGAKVTERSANTGMQEADLRRVVGRPDKAKFRKNMESYAKSVYASKKLKKTRHPDPRDLSRRFRLTLEMHDAHRAWTSDRFARMKLDTSVLFSDAGPYLMRPPKPDDKSFKRKHPLYLPGAYRAELVYRLTAPPAYDLKSRPKSGKRKLGPATYSWTVTEEKDGKRVVARYRFDLGKRRWSAKELQTFWRALRRLRQEVAEGEVVFEHRGHRLRREGKLREALDLYRELHRRHPDQPVYYRQLANALLHMGFGERSRALLRRGVKRFPKSANLRFILGYHLEHSPYGKEHAAGWDRAGALAAYRQAVKRDPKETVYRVALSRLLTFDQRMRYLHGAKALAPALHEMRHLREKLDHKDIDPRYAWTLLRAGHLNRLRTALPNLKMPKSRGGFALALALVKRPALDPLASARRIAGQDRQVPAVLVKAALVLMEIGRYRQAGKLFTVIGRLGNMSPDKLKVFQRMKSWAYLERRAKSPREVVLRALWLAAADRLPRAKLDSALVSKKMCPEARKELLEALQTAGRLQRNGHDFQDQLSAIAAADLALSELRVKVEGDDKLGYYARVQDENRRVTYLSVYLIKEGAGYRIRATRAVLQEVGVEALARIKRGDLKGARKWLDWLRGRRDAPVSPYFGSSFSHLWEAGARRSREHTRITAAVVASQSKTHIKRARRILERALARGPDRELRIQLLRKLVTIYGKTGQFKKSARLIKKLWRMSHRSRHLLMLHIRTLLNAGELRTAERVARRYRKRHPHRWQGTQALALVAKRRGRFQQARKLQDELLDRRDPPEFLYNNRAWLGLFLKPFDSEATLKIARRAVTLSQEKSATRLDTLAAVAAEAGKLKEAREAFTKCLDRLGWDRPRKHAWYTYGRIAEGLGLKAEARAAYRQVPKPKDRSLTDSWHLAQHRLKVLGKAKRKAKRKPDAKTNASK